jgi:predicted GNAT family acetyltransferase
MVSMDAASPCSSDQDTDGFVVVDAALGGGPSRFELHRDGELVGWATYRREDGTVVIPHVETLVEYRGQGFADRLMAGIVGIVRGAGGTIMPLCSFAAGYLRDHPEHDDVAVTPRRP